MVTLDAVELEFVRELVSGATAGQIVSAVTLRAHIASHDARANTVERAALVGLAADGVGWAFAGGYQAALAMLDPNSTRNGALAALCATEEAGGHPRAIRTSLSPRTGGGWTLSGRKTWVTLGAEADVLLVVASTGEGVDGRNRLRVARVPSTRAGIAFEARAALPFASEIAHARATFDSVEVGGEELLSGDGYDAALKPFRTIEDVHVSAALLGWSIGVARANGWERAWIEEAISLVVLLRAVNSAPPSRAETHVALAGTMMSTHRLLDAAAWPRTDTSTRERWKRDRPLLDVASSVRAARGDAAWRELTS